MKKTFSLIELLVVISIIGVLSAVTVVGLNSMRYKGFDATRLADLRNIEIALETYKSVNGVYPDAGEQGTDEYIIGLSPFTASGKLAKDPQRKHNGTDGYIYQVSTNKKGYCFSILNTIYKPTNQPDIEISGENSWKVCHGASIQ